MDTIFSFVCIGFVLVAVGLVVKSFFDDKKRRAAFERLAREWSFDFYHGGSLELQNSLDKLDLFNRGSSRRITNLLTGRARDLEVAVFDYRYTMGSGKNSSVHSQTVICLAMKDSWLPTFSMRPESLLHKVGAWFGYQDIDFSSHPRFSGRFLLRGPNEESIRALFADDVLDFFENHQDICVEGAENRLIVYQQNREIDPDAIGDLMADGFEIMNVLRGDAAR